ncbi:HTH_Tnp_Tc3_2 domain-containing protein [Trichonephila clavipes]|nr:HTH_Tnp_Tc3_2 domain-containing protein [Trichonephila clavipes]
MATVDFLHPENPPTWAGVESANLGAGGQRQTNHATQPLKMWKEFVCQFRTKTLPSMKPDPGTRKPFVILKRRLKEQWTREGTHARKTGSGATRKTTSREDRRIVRQALVDPTVTRSTIRADVAIVPQTISRHLAEANLKSKRPFRALPLTPEHRQLRLQ